MARTATSIRINYAELGRLLKGPEARNDLSNRGLDIAAAAGVGYEAGAAEEGYEVEPAYVGKSRARVTVRTATTEARVQEPITHTLASAIDAGRAFNG